MLSTTRAPRLWTVIALVAALSLMMTTGCRRIGNVVYSRFAAIDADGWNPATVYELNPWPEDSVNPKGSLYDMTICVRYSTARNGKPLDLIVRHYLADGTERDDTMHIELPNRLKPGMKQAHGIYEVVDTVTTRMPLEEGYFAELITLTPQERSRGVINVGLTLTLAN